MKKLRQCFSEFIKPNLNALAKRIWNINKKTHKIIFKVIMIAALGAFIVIPFLHNYINHMMAKWIWYPVGILLFLESVSSNIRNGRPRFKTPTIEYLSKWGEFGIYPTFISVFVLNYYSIDYIWQWVIFGIIALCVPLFFISLLLFEIKQNGMDTRKQEKAFRNIIKYIFLCWFIDLFYMSIFNNLLIPSFIFGIMSLVIICFNLITAFLNGAKTLQFFIALEMIVALILSVYLIFIIPNKTLQEIVLVIVAALYGGLLTLVGVAWTIKNGTVEKKELDRKNACPFIGIINLSSQKIGIANNNIIFFNRKNCEGSLLKKICCCLENSDKCTFFLNKIQLDDVDYFPDSSTLISKNEIFAISILETSDWCPEDKTIRMFITDTNYEQRIFDILSSNNCIYDRIIENTD